MTNEMFLDPKNYYGNSSYMDANPDLYWRLDEITNYTPEMMRELIKKETGVEDYFPSGKYVLVKHYVKEQGLFKNVASSEEEFTKFNHRTSMVLAFGPAAFREKKEYPAGAQCLIGQYSQYKRYDNDMIMLGGHVCSLVYDFRLQSLVGDPKNVDTGW